MESALIRVVKKASLYIFLAWSIVITVSFLAMYYHHHHEAIDGAVIEARTHSEYYKKVMSGFGDIYVKPDTAKDLVFCPDKTPDPSLCTEPVTGHSPPNMNVTTTDGHRLTLVNPVIRTRVVFENIKGKTELPVLNRLTSLKLYNPKNEPDEWEKAALIAFEKGETESQEITSIDGAPYLRVIRPLFVEKSCLRCHADQGYKEGDVRGGVSIAVPMEPYYKNERKTVWFIFWMHSLLWAVVSACIFGVTKIAVKNARIYEETRVMSLRDPLTGLANRRFMEIDLKECFDVAKRYKTPFSAIMADIDNFKQFNDSKGHQAGDLLLKGIAGIISRETRQTDLAIRYGGEEFLIVLHQTGLADAVIAAERIRKAVETETEVTLSLGVSVWRETMQQKEDITKEADKALYAAKQNGRNRVEVYS